MGTANLDLTKSRQLNAYVAHFLYLLKLLGTKMSILQLLKKRKHDEGFDW